MPQTEEQKIIASLRATAKTNGMSWKDWAKENNLDYGIVRDVVCRKKPIYKGLRGKAFQVYKALGLREDFDPREYVQHLKAKAQGESPS